MGGMTSKASYCPRPSPDRVCTEVNRPQGALKGVCDPLHCLPMWSEETAARIARLLDTEFARIALEDAAAEKAKRVARVQPE